MPERKEIRGAIESVIRNVHPDVPVFTRRHVDGIGLADFVTVYLANGETQYTGIKSYTEAVLSIGIFSNLFCDDDVLDDIGDTIQAAIAADPSLGGLVCGMVYTGFEYPMEDEPNFSQLILNYAVQY